MKLEESYIKEDCKNINDKITKSCNDSALSLALSGSLDKLSFSKVEPNILVPLGHFDKKKLLWV